MSRDVRKRARSVGPPLTPEDDENEKGAAPATPLIHLEIRAASERRPEGRRYSIARRMSASSCAR